MDPSPTLDQLQVFLAVAKEGGFSAAARRLGRAQSVVSYAVANLEAQLEVRLFERAGTRQPRLTAAGRALMADARRMVAGLELLRARARGLGQGLEGEVAVAVEAVLPMPVLTVALAAFRAAFPTVGVRLYSGSLGAVVDLVLRREAHLGIAGQALIDHDDLVARRIGRNQFVPVAAPAHPLALLAAPVPASLVQEHFQIVVTDLTERTRGRDFHVHAFNTWRVTDAETKRALLIAGLGWGGLPAWMVEDDVAGGRLVELDLEPYPRTDYTLHAIRAADAPWGPASAWLADRFEQELGAFEDPARAATAPPSPARTAGRSPAARSRSGS